MVRISSLEQEVAEKTKAIDELSREKEDQQVSKLVSVFFELSTG